jgi:DNA (cytosine-5)-methyltransferase 1
MTWAVDLFGGPGGWDTAARDLGLATVGIENERWTCSTRYMVGLETIRADVARLDPTAIPTLGDPRPPPDVLIASPPCPTFSNGGLKEGLADLRLIGLVTRDLAAGRVPEDVPHEWQDARSRLVTEPLRWALAIRPALIVLEQVPPVLDYWHDVGDVLRLNGYRVWTGLIDAERYGVPQTRRRAFLLASRVHDPAPPAPTHQRYRPGEPARHDVTLEGEILPWVSMATALEWDEHDVVGFPRLADDLEATDDGYRARDIRPAVAPAFNLTEKARSWQRWPYHRPATTVQGDERIWAPGHKRNAADDAAGRDYYGERAGTDAIRVEVHEAGVLQGFPSGYPWQGPRTHRFAQIGNAVPPPLARAILAELTAGLA